jgi:peptide-methionine (S)-S-oxide reductase
MRQGNDRGTQYRSGIYTFSEAQREAAQRTKAAYETRLQAAGYGAITTEILPAGSFYMPRTTTSSTCTRTRGAIAESAGRA